ncbi:MAG: FAD binding domain-containing protein [Candidatus Promineifilaceae bacterium]|nr:FAD binding domain-containing protein [Candidatus Promineifilaceae bacterium]
MPHLQAYHRPENLEQALQLLAREGVRSAVVAGGTRIVPTLKGVDEVVDLQRIGLDEQRHGADSLSLGALVRVQSVVDDERAPDLLREVARREGPNTMRNQGTIGGAIVAPRAESELLAALLVYDAAVTVQTLGGAHPMSLSEFLADVQGSLRGGIVTDVALQTGGATAHTRVARTPQDAPIVAAVARRDGEGALHLALCGVGERPLLIAPEEIDDLQPPADFRGSSAYRRQMARVLTERVLAAL